jgi:tryptophan synthase alpha chain
VSVGPVLAACREEGRAALIGYLPVGFPTVEGSLEAMQVLVDNGVDIVEIGVPYSDPVMDGPVIQDAAVRALAAGVRLSDIFTATGAVSGAGAGALVMTYWNPVLRYGVERFAADLAAAGGAGLITPDLIPDEAGDWIAAADGNELDRVFLVAPSSTPERLATVTAACRGFVYATAVMGVTGARSSVGAAADELVSRTRTATDLPVCVGVGVSTGAQATEVGRYADGVIVGSALVRCLTEAPSPEAGLEALGALTRELADGVRSGRR